MTNQELSDKFALEYAGWTKDNDILYGVTRWKDADGDMVWDYSRDSLGKPRFTDSADAVHPYLEDWDGGSQLRQSELSYTVDREWIVKLFTRENQTTFWIPVAEGRGTLARAIVEALLQTKNVSK